MFVGAARKENHPKSSRSARENGGPWGRTTGLGNELVHFQIGLFVTNDRNLIQTGFDNEGSWWTWGTKPSAGSVMRNLGLAESRGSDNIIWNDSSQSLGISTRCVAFGLGVSPAVARRWTVHILFFTSISERVCFSPKTPSRILGLLIIVLSWGHLIVYHLSRLLSPKMIGGSDSKESACNAGDWDSIPGSGRSRGEGNGYRLQYSCLENSMDRGAWQATVHGAAKSETWLSD